MSESLAALSRLATWSDDELHLTRSVRMHEPIYQNPRQLRSDVRTLISEYEEICTMFNNVMDTMGVEYDDMFPKEEEDE